MANNTFGFQGGGGGSTPITGVESVTGLNTDNTDPQNPIVQISVDGITISGNGTLSNPLQSNGVPYVGANQSVNLGVNNMSANNYFDGFTSVVASASLITLTIASTPSWLVTGSGGQTIKLPNATTLPKGAIYQFNNNQSSGTILVNNNSNTLVKSIGSGSLMFLELTDNTTPTGLWDAHFQAPSNVSWTTNTLDYAGSITSATWNGVAIADLRIASASTWNAKQNAITLTTTGTSGASTLVGSTLNIPQYSIGSSNPSVVAVNVPDGTQITGSTLTISTSLFIAANTILTNSILQLNWGIQRISGTGGTVINQVYINTTNSLTGATLVATGGNLSTAQTYVNCSRDIQKVGTVAKTSMTTQMVNDGTISTSINTFTLNNATDLYMIFACQGGIGDVSVIRQVRLTQYT